MKHLVLLSILLLAGGCSVLRLERPPERDAAMRLEQGLASLDAGLYGEAFDDLAWVYSRCAGHTASHEALAALAALELDPRNPEGREAVGAELLGRLIQHPGPPAWTRPLTEAGYLMALALGAPAPLEADTAGPAGPVSADTATPAPTPSPSGAAGSTRSGGATRGPLASDAEAADTMATGATVAGEPLVANGPAAAAAPPPAPAPTDEAVRGCGAPVDSGDWVAARLPELPGPSLVSILGAIESERAVATTRADSLSRVLTATKRELQETRAELERIRKTLKP